MGSLTDEFLANQVIGNLLMAVLTGASLVQLGYNSWFRSAAKHDVVLAELVLVDFIANGAAILTLFLPLINTALCPFFLAAQMIYANATLQLFLNRVASVFYQLDAKESNRLTTALMVYYLAAIGSQICLTIANKGVIRAPTARQELTCVMQSANPTGVAGLMAGLAIVALSLSTTYILVKSISGFVHFRRGFAARDNNSAKFYLLKLVFLNLGLNLALTFYEGLSIFLSWDAEGFRFAVRMIIQITSMVLSSIAVVKIFPRARSSPPAFKIPETGIRPVHVPRMLPGKVAAFPNAFKTTRIAPQ